MADQPASATCTPPPVSFFHLLPHLPGHSQFPCNYLVHQTTHGLRIAFPTVRLLTRNTSFAVIALRRWACQGTGRARQNGPLAPPRDAVPVLPLSSSSSMRPFSLSLSLPTAVLHPSSRPGLQPAERVPQKCNRTQDGGGRLRRPAPCCCRGQARPPCPLVRPVPHDGIETEKGG